MTCKFSYFLKDGILTSVQDQGLEVIAEGLDTLKNMAHDMNEELDRQVPLMDEIDTKVLNLSLIFFSFFFYFM